MNSFRSGVVVLFHLQGELLCGMILSRENDYYQVLAEDGTLHRLNSKRFSLVSAQSYAPLTLEGLKLFQSRVEERLESLDEDQIAARLRERESGFTFPEAVGILGFIDDVSHFALFHLIKQNPQTYLWKKDQISLRSDEQRQSYARESALQQERELYLNKVKAFLDTYMRAAEAASLEEDTKAVLVNDLSSIILFRKPRDLIKLLRNYSDDSDMAGLIKELRIAVGDLDPDTDPIAAEAGIPVSFPSWLWKQAVHPVLQTPAQVEAFSIDAEGTPDFDDALSLTQLPEGWLIGVHVSSVADRLPLGSALYEEALRRVSSLYLPGETIPLLPPELSNSAFSLIQGQSRPVLSLHARFDQDFNLLSWEFTPEWISVQQNLTYQQADAMLQQSPFQELVTLSGLLAQERGVQELPAKPQYDWQVKVFNGQISLKRINNVSPAHSVVEEFMILYNRLFAELATQHSLPLIYRNINQFQEDEGDPEAPPFSSQAYLSTTPQFHPGIGSRAYLHATSPIRRFADIINQYQMSAFLAGNPPPFDSAALEAMIPAIEKRLLLLKEIGQRSERYWFLRYLQINCLNTPLDAVIVKNLRQGCVAELSAWQKRVILFCDSDPPLYTPVKLVLDAVDLKQMVAKGDVIL